MLIGGGGGGGVPIINRRTRAVEPLRTVTGRTKRIIVAKLFDRRQFYDVAVIDRTRTQFDDSE